MDVGIGLTSVRASRDDLGRAARGYLSESYPLMGNSSSQAFTSQRIEASIVGLRAGDVVTNVHYYQTVAATSVTLARVAIYSKAGALLASSASDTTIVTAAAGLRTVALSSAYSVPADDGYYVALLAVFTGTAPTVVRGGSNAGAYTAVGSGVHGAAAQTGQTDLPSTSVLAASGTAFWFAVS